MVRQRWEVEKAKRKVRGITDWNELLWEVLDFVGLKVIKSKVHPFLEDTL